MLSRWELLRDIETSISGFNVMVEKYRLFCEQNKRFPSQSAKNSEEKRLGRWVSMQRQLYKNNKLDKWKVELLEKLEMWFWDPFIDIFMDS